MVDDKEYSALLSGIAAGGEGCSFLSVKISCLRFLRKDYLIDYIHL